MTLHLSIHTGELSISRELFDSNFPGVHIRGDLPKDFKPIINSNGYVLTCDSAEHLLNLIVEFSKDIDVGLFAAWLYEIIQKSSRKKVTINGKQIPEDQAELALLIKKLIEEQNNLEQDQRRDS